MTKELRELNQDDFNMKIVKDLGLKPVSNYNKRFAIFECVECRKHFETSCASAKYIKQKFCNSCSKSLSSNKKTKDDYSFKLKMIGDIKTINGRKHADFKCKCGVVFTRRVDLMIRNQDTSCGCSRVYGKEIHGDYKKRIYRIWCKMKSRCLNEKNDSFDYYGGLGVAVCQEWVNSYLSFKKWALDSGYSDELTIDRINPYGNYEPKNCRWVCRTIQQRNQRRIRKNNTSGYRGVCFSKSMNKFTASICVDWKSINLGYSDDKLECAKMYDRYVIENNLEHTINGVL